MKTFRIAAVGLILGLSACGQPGSPSNQNKGGSYRYFLPANHNETPSKPAPSKIAALSDVIMNYAA